MILKFPNFFNLSALRILPDSREAQILALGLFLGLGVWTRDWTLHPESVGVAILSCLVVQWLGQWLRQRLGQALQSTALGDGREIAREIVVGNHGGIAEGNHGAGFNWRSPLITALGLSLLLRVDHWLYMVLAAIVAIGSKFLIQIHHKHLFNPANVGIIAALSLIPGAWVSPGQWGDEGWYALLFAGIAGIILKRVGRWDTSLAFLSTYGALEAARSLWLGWTWDVTLHRLMSGSLLLFAFFMITDPRSIPDRPLARILWTMSIAALTFILRNQFYLSTAPFWALFALAPLTPLLDRLWPSDRFEWETNPIGENFTQIS